MQPSGSKKTIDETSEMMMMTAQTWILRTSVVLGMVAAVVTILYLTPMPEHQIVNCDRSCHELDWPMICRIQMTLEQYHTFTRSCEDCLNNSTHCDNEHCVPADGVSRGIFTANRKLPGPTIRVCQNDILVVDVINRIPGQEFSIHWRGQPQHGTQCMDGVPMITQCPIPSFTTFQYKFRASSAGTHLWHAHSTTHASEGLFGALVVKQADILEPQRRLYDEDVKEHTIVVAEWNRKSQHPVSLLLNGRSNFGDQMQRFYVKKGLRYRFRLAYAAGAGGCPVEFSVENHPIRIIALDGNPVNPFEVSSVVFGRGERVDFILKANRPLGAYLMKVSSRCSNATTAALVVYEEAAGKLPKEPEERFDVVPRVFYTDVCASELGKVCVGDVQSLFVMPASLRTEKVDAKMHLAFEHLTIGEYDKTHTRLASMNNLTFTFPSSPLLTQLDDVIASTLCNKDEQPEHCSGQEPCECVHVERIPLDSTVEIVLIDAGGEEENVFHLHGYSFYVVASRNFSEPIAREEVEELDSQGKLFSRNLISPARKDTIRIPKNGVVALRFIASNPGFWMLRDEHANHWTRGIDTILQVGDQDDLQSPPSNFPKCGNWIGPQFFLI